MCWCKWRCATDRASLRLTVCTGAAICRWRHVPACLFQARGRAFTVRAGPYLFVIGLVLLVSGWRRLIYVITAFTVAHSLTLGLSMLGRISAPSAVVEAIIALSILFVAVGCCSGLKTLAIGAKLSASNGLWFRPAARFGFAGMLAAIGLPRDVEIWALALFNIGLEVGQLLVVAVMLYLRYAQPRLLAVLARHEKGAPAVTHIVLQAPDCHGWCICSLAARPPKRHWQLDYSAAFWLPRLRKRLDGLPIRL